MPWSDYARLTDFANGKQIGNSPGQLSLNTELDNAYAGVNAAADYVDEVAANFVLGTVSDGSITVVKLAFDPATQTELDAAIRRLRMHASFAK